MKLKPMGILVAGIFATATAFADDTSSTSSTQSQQPEQQSQQQSQQQAQQSPEVVKQVQEKLSAAGHDAGPADGQMGPKTQAALKDFQEKEGLQASGQIDQQTLAALEIGGQSSSTGSSSAPSQSEKQKSE